MHDYFTHVLHSYSWGIMSIENDNSTQENSSDIAYIGANDGLQESIKATFRRVLVPRDYLCLNSFLFDRGGRDGGKREGGMDGGKEGGREERRQGVSHVFAVCKHKGRRPRRFGHMRDRK